LWGSSRALYGFATPALVKCHGHAHTGQVSGTHRSRFAWSGACRAHQHVHATSPTFIQELGLGKLFLLLLPPSTKLPACQLGGAEQHQCIGRELSLGTQFQCICVCKSVRKCVCVCVSVRACARVPGCSYTRIHACMLAQPFP